MVQKKNIFFLITMSIKFGFVHDCDDMKCSEINTFTVKSYTILKYVHF